MHKIEETPIYKFQSIPNDPNNVRIYTLQNGLTVYLAQNFNAPRIQTYIPVRTGSNNDPKDNTGLAHYLEHMMFKGSSALGTTDWESEKTLLDKISDLYELHKTEKSIEKKMEIYKQIDHISQDASKYAVANEYDKLLASIGASGTNAHTWFDETVYKNNIPKNELRKWLKIESNRFSDLVLRLFHTELEAVYEEFNRAQDHDGRLVHETMLKALFPTHPNGQQTTLGSAEHLKNPSMKAIHQYFKTYYVPNNMAIVMVGDLDFDETIALVDQYFGAMEFRELPAKQPIEEKPLEEVIRTKVKSPSSPRLQMAWRTDSYGTREARMAEIAALILSNDGETGLIDVHINQEQTALRAGAYNSPLKNYGFVSMLVVPKEQQSLEEAEQLLLNEIEKLKNGDFADWLIPAIVQDLRLTQTKEWETADGLATSLYEAFIRERTWEDELQETELFSRITKADIVAFAQDFFKDNYVVVYKEFGENEKLIRVENPEINPIQIDKVGKSKFFEEVLREVEVAIKPDFVDYEKEILIDEISGRKISFVENKTNDIAQATYIFDLGLDHDKELGLALGLLDFLGTDKFTAEELKAEFYKLGIAFFTNVKPDQIMLNLEGPEGNIIKGVELLHHWFGSVVANEEVYHEVVETILQGRIYSKKDKKRIAKALRSYGKYGAQSRFRDVISEEKLKKLAASDLVLKLHDFLRYPHQIYFYGQNFERFCSGIAPLVSGKVKELPMPTVYPEPKTTGKVYFTNYEMVQVELFKLGRGSVVNPKTFGAAKLYNEYFGSGLSSIVFQEIREARSLAYSAYAHYRHPAKLEKHDYLTAYVGTQANKLLLATSAMNELMEDFPLVEGQFLNAKENVLKQIASSRIERRKLFFQYLVAQRYGVKHDLRKDIYEEIRSLSLLQLKEFSENKIQNMNFNTAILGDKRILKSQLENFPELEELTLEDLFGY